MATVDVERVASPHLYEDERVVWMGEQPIPRKMPLRLLAAMPGVLVIAAVVATMQGLVESDPLVVSGEHGLALPLTLAAIAAAGALWIWGVVYRPVRAYRGVQRVHGVLTDRRFLWVEELGDGTTRVRHPFRAAMLRAGDVRTLEVRERGGGGGDVAIRGASSLLGTVRVGTQGPSVGETAALLGRVLRVPERPQPLAGEVAGGNRGDLPGGTSQLT